MSRSPAATDTDRDTSNDTGANGPEVSVGSCWNTIGVQGDRSCPELLTVTHCRNCPVFAAAAQTFLDRSSPAGYLADWSGQLDDPGAGEGEDLAREATGLLIFRLGAEWLALRAASVVEVTPVHPLHRIPHRSNEVLLGLVNLRGQLHLCASLHGLLGVAPEPRVGANPSPAPERPGRMVVIRRQGESWVFTAEEVLGAPRLPPSLFRAVPSTHANPAVSFSQAVFTWHGHSIGLLDEARLFEALRSHCT